MIEKITFNVLPPTLNEIIRLAEEGRYGSVKKQFTLICAIAASGCPSFPGEVWLACDWRISNFRRDPADNVVASLKFVLDGLVNLGVLKDDSALVIQPPVVHNWIQTNNEGLTLTISTEPIFEALQKTATAKGLDKPKPQKATAMRVADQSGAIGNWFSKLA